MQQPASFDVSAFPPPTALRRALSPMLKLVAGMLLASQLVAGLVYLGLNWQRERFLARATKTEAVLLSVNPDGSGYRMQISYPVNGRQNRTSVLVQNPPAIPIGEALEVYVDPENFWRVEVPGPSAFSLPLLGVICAAFPLCFSFFVLLGGLATSSALGQAPPPPTLLEHDPRKSA